MWLLYALAQESPSGGPALSLTDAAVYYGIAAPFIIYLLWTIRQKDQEKQKVDERLDNVTERLIAQQAETVPLLRDATDALAEATRELAGQGWKHHDPPTR